MRRSLPIWLCAALFTVGAPAAEAQDIAPLPALGAEGARVSVSGLSSGGYMAVQYGVAFSAETMGVGVVAGGPYGCALTYGLMFLKVCMKAQPSRPDPGTAADIVTQAAGTQAIDPVAGIAAQRIYLFTGGKDDLVEAPVMAALRDFYVAEGVAPANLAYVDTIPAGHAFVAPSSGNACGTDAAPYVEHCAVDTKAYDQPKAILTQIYGKLRKRRSEPAPAPIAFDQRPYGAADARMADTGYLFVPGACRKTRRRCAVHVVFHGCQQSAAVVKDAVYGQVGYNEWADRNRIVILYPQVDRSAGPDPAHANPLGCWDWWGYSASPASLAAYLFRSGPQLATVHRMVARLTSPRED